MRPPTQSATGYYFIIAGVSGTDCAWGLQASWWRGRAWSACGRAYGSRRRPMSARPASSSKFALGAQPARVILHAYVGAQVPPILTHRSWAAGHWAHATHGRRPSRQGCFRRTKNKIRRGRKNRSRKRSRCKENSKNRSEHSCPKAKRIRLAKRPEVSLANGIWVDLGYIDGIRSSIANYIAHT